MSINLEHVHCARCGEIITPHDVEWYEWRDNGRRCFQCVTYGDTCPTCLGRGCADCMSEDAGAER